MSSESSLENETKRTRFLERGSGLPWEKNDQSLKKAEGPGTTHAGLRTWTPSNFKTSGTIRTYGYPPHSGFADDFYTIEPFNIGLNTLIMIQTRVLTFMVQDRFSDIFYYTSLRRRHSSFRRQVIINYKLELNRGSVRPNYPNFPCQHKKVRNLVCQTKWAWYPNPMKVNLTNHDWGKKYRVRRKFWECLKVMMASLKWEPRKSFHPFFLVFLVCIRGELFCA